MKVEQKVRQYLDKIKKEDKKINAFLELNPNVIDEAKAVDAKKSKGRLAGYIIGVKSNINVKGLTTSCASKTLEDYKATYDASVIESIKKEDGVIIGMLNCDEFACGVSGETSAFGPTHNPIVPGCVPGGSSSGSAAAVAAGFCDMALGSDTGGSIRVPSAFCGVVGVKPSYGCVSRYGLVDLSMSLDQIGPIAKNVEDAALLLDVIKGKDERDATTFESKPIKLSSEKNIRIGTVSIDGIDSSISKLVNTAIGGIVSKLGWKDQEVKVPHIDLAIQTYHPIVWTEFFSATKRFDGRKYGKKISEVAGAEVLRRISGGSEISKAEFEGRYYHRALQVKSMIKEGFERIFEKVDCVMMPTTPMLPWKLGSKLSVEDFYSTDALVIPANLAGVCSVSIPVGFVKGKPVGMQVICANGQENKMLSIANLASEVLK